MWLLGGLLIEMKIDGDALMVSDLKLMLPSVYLVPSRLKKSTPYETLILGVP